jgi:cellulose synthase (UDP-forming)
VYLLPALLSVIVNPRKPTFKVTAKDESVSVSRISELGGPFYIIFAVLALGVVMTVWRIVAQPYEADVTLVVGGWNLLNLLMVGCALGVVSERRNPQTSHRVTVARRCDLLVGDRVVPATIEDVSVGGARIRVPGEAMEGIERGAPSSVRFTPQSDIGADTLPLAIRSIVREGNAAFLGCRFMPTGATDYRLIADLIFANSEQWSQFQQSRRLNIGIVRGTIWFLGLSIFQTFRGLAYLIRRLRITGRVAVPAPAVSEK